MTAEELSGLATAQRSIDRLTDKFEKLADKLDHQIAATATGFESVRVDLASVKARFIGGWLAVAAIASVVAVVGTWIVELHPHIQF